MNYKAIVLCLLLAIPVGLIAMPLHKANALVTPALFVTPPIDLEGPCHKGETFSIDVWLLNMEISNGGNDIFAFDFTLDWSTILGDDGLPIIALVNDSITIHSPWPSGGYFVVANETTPPLATNNDTQTTGTFPWYWLVSDYHLAITAIPPKGTGLFDVNQSVVTLTFVVLQDACFPADYVFDGLTGGFLLTAKISGDGTSVIPLTSVTIEGGIFEEHAYPPNIEIMNAEAVKGVITEKCASHEIDIQVDLTNATKVFGYGFQLFFDGLPAAYGGHPHLEVDLQKTTFKPGFPPPYELVSALPAVYVNGTGFVYAALNVVIVRPSEKPTICGADVPVFDVILHTIDGLDTDSLLPTKSTTYIGISWAFVLAKDCGPDSTVFEYAKGTPTVPAAYAALVTDTYGLIYNQYLTGAGLGPDLTYYFKPSKYDLNLDCVVDIQDLMVLLPFYDTIVGSTTYHATTPPAFMYGDLFNDPLNPGLVDIFDFVAIAKHFGPVDP